VALVGLVAAIIASVRFLPVHDYLMMLPETVQGLGAWGPILIAALYVPVCLLFIPGSLLTLAAGFALGVVRGTIAVSIGSVIGATCAFLVGRFLARDAIEKKIANNPSFRAIDQAVGEQGLKLVLLIRLSPLFPFNLLNYAFGLTKVRLRDYILGSWIGMFPGTVMYVYLGSAAKDVADLVAGRFEGGIGQKALFGVGLVATIIVTALATRLAKHALGRRAPTIGADATSLPSVPPTSSSAKPWADAG
jgi:uncharacterized membrane protein YdjX (TVP38/TMEM64 family)